MQLRQSLGIVFGLLVCTFMPWGTWVAFAALNATISWQDLSTDETSFTVERQVNGGVFAAVGTVGANVTSFNDTNALALGNAYCYRAYASNALGNSGPSNVLCYTPNTPIAPNILTVIFQP